MSSSSNRPPENGSSYNNNLKPEGNSNNFNRLPIPTFNNSNVNNNPQRLMGLSPPIPKWEELQTPAQTDYPRQQQNLGYNYSIGSNGNGMIKFSSQVPTQPSIGPCGNRPSVLMPINRYRTMTINNNSNNHNLSDFQQQNPNSNIGSPSNLIPVPMNRNVVQWLKPISKNCTIEQFFQRINDHLFLEALNLFTIFYYNRPSNRASISMLNLFKSVMEVCEVKLWEQVVHKLLEDRIKMGVDVNVAQHAICSLYRLNLLPFEEFHFRNCRPEALPGVDMVVLRGRAEQWKATIQTNQNSNMSSVVNSIQVNQIINNPTAQQQTVATSPSQAPFQLNTSVSQSIAQQQQQTKKLPELLSLICEKRTKPSEVLQINIQYLENCYKSSTADSTRIFVWNSLLPLLANSKISNKDIFSLQYLAIEMEKEIISLSSDLFKEKLLHIGELDFKGQMESYLKEDPIDNRDGLEQMIMVFYCLVNLNNFSIFFSKRPKLIKVLKDLLVYRVLSIEAWERLLEGYELVQRFIKNEDEQFDLCLVNLMCADVERSVDRVASKSVLSLQLGDLNGSEEVSSFPWVILPRRTFFMLSIIHNLNIELERINRTLKKLLQFSYYKVIRQLRFKEEKLKRDQSMLLKLSYLEDYGYVELALMILNKSKTKQYDILYWGLFRHLWQFYYSFHKMTISGNSTIVDIGNNQNQSSLTRMLKLLVPFIDIDDIDIVEEIFQMNLLLSSSSKSSIAQIVLDEVTKELMNMVYRFGTIGDIDTFIGNDNFDWGECCTNDK